MCCKLWFNANNLLFLYDNIKILSKHKKYKQRRKFGQLKHIFLNIFWLTSSWMGNQIWWDLYKNALTTTLCTLWLCRATRKKRNKLISSIYLWQKCEFSHENKKNISHDSKKKLFLYYLLPTYHTTHTYAALKCLKTQRLQLYYGNLNLHGFMVVTTTCLINFSNSFGYGRDLLVIRHVN